MPVKDNRERERRFLVPDRYVISDQVGDELEQGYLFSSLGWKARVRRTYTRQEDGALIDGVAMFTLKGPKEGFESPEYEMRIEIAHAAELLAAAPFRVSKTRYQLLSEGSAWEIDVFHGTNEGLIIAECEGSAAVLEKLKRPTWATVEVTSDERYNNENLAERPWLTWPEQQQ